MLCEKCKKNEASVFYEENINGKRKSLTLCESCAEKMKEKGELQSPASIFGDFYDPFSELHDHLFGGLFTLPSATVKKIEKKCPKCGTTYSEIAKQGKVGCAECYTAFSEELSRLIQNIHGTTKHTGSVPAREREKSERNEKIRTLKKELSQAVELEEYERAAQLRDEIRSMENENKGTED